MTTTGSTTSCSSNLRSAAGSASRTLVSSTYVRVEGADVLGARRREELSATATMGLLADRARIARPVLACQSDRDCCALGLDACPVGWCTMGLP